MITQFRLRETRLALRNGIHNCRMITDDLSCFAVYRQMKSANAIDVSTAAANKLSQIGHARGIV